MSVFFSSMGRFWLVLVEYCVLFFCVLIPVESWALKNELPIPEKSEKQTKREKTTDWKIDGRLRVNSFWHDRRGESIEYGKTFSKYSADGTSLYDPRGFVTVLGLKIETPRKFGWSALLDQYFGDDLGVLSTNDGKFGKSGKDSFVRDRVTNNPQPFHVAAQAYLSFNENDWNLKFGRFVFESPLTSANDTKAVPNTFQGASIEKKLQKGYRFAFAVLSEQKLRDRNYFHDLLLYGASEEANDDSGVHKGLTKAKAMANGVDDSPELFVLGLNRKTKIATNKLYLYALSGFFQTMVYEGLWQIGKKGQKGRPTWQAGIRFLNQDDQGAGAIGGPSLTGTGTPAGNALDGHLVAGKVQASWLSSQVSLGYSRVADRGDIVAPWRGFPTYGYTRNMTEVNWTAGTKSWMASYLIDLEKARIWNGAKIVFNVANHDRRETVGKRSEDSKAYHSDLTYKFPGKPSLEAKLRYLIHHGNGEQEFTDSRLELIYFF